MDDAARKQRIAEHLEAIRRLEAEAAVSTDSPAWPPKGFYLLWHVVVGMMLGTIGASVSLFANIVGATLFGKHPLELIRVYLTFPMGEQALHADRGLVLFMGCALYLVTGAFYGIGFHLLFTTVLKHATFKRRLITATGLGLGVWVVNFYFVLSWLQPLLLGGNWIVTMVPFW